MPALENSALNTLLHVCYSLAAPKRTAVLHGAPMKPVAPAGYPAGALGSTLQRCHFADFATNSPFRVSGGLGNGCSDRIRHRAAGDSATWMAFDCAGRRWH